MTKLEQALAIIEKLEAEAVPLLEDDYAGSEVIRKIRKARAEVEGLKRGKR
ncbi:MAG: hypothetical protein WC876_01740 [Candidatus Thermoplasmatota archaeon]|jgi:hypothetical protein